MYFLQYDFTPRFKSIACLTKVPSDLAAGGMKDRGRDFT